MNKKLLIQWHSHSWGWITIQEIGTATRALETINHYRSCNPSLRYRLAVASTTEILDYWQIREIPWKRKIWTCVRESRDVFSVWLPCRRRQVGSVALTGDDRSYQQFLYSGLSLRETILWTLEKQFEVQKRRILISDALIRVAFPELCLFRVTRQSEAIRWPPLGYTRENAPDPYPPLAPY